jgi:hypothetical protein
MTIDVLIADHHGVDCLEVVFYNPDTDEECRLYLCKHLLGEKLNMPNLTDKVQEIKEKYIRQKKLSEFVEEDAIWEVKHDLMVQYVTSRISIPSKESEEDEFVVELKVNFGDISVEKNGKKQLDIILDCIPETITPLRTKQNQRIS